MLPHITQRPVGNEGGKAGIRVWVCVTMQIADSAMADRDVGLNPAERRALPQSFLPAEEEDEEEDEWDEDSEDEEDVADEEDVEDFLCAACFEIPVEQRKGICPVFDMHDVRAACYCGRCGTGRPRPSPWCCASISVCPRCWRKRAEGDKLKVAHALAAAAAKMG